VKQLDGEKAHPFLEQCLTMMGLLQKVTKNTAAAEESYRNLVQITESYYGGSSENLMVSLKNLATVLAQQDKNEDAQRTLERALSVGKAALDANKIRGKAAFK